LVENIPYGTYVQECLGDRGLVLVRGVCGETTQDMRLRFQEDVLDHLPQVAIILGGTNDLSLGISLAAMMENLSFFYEQAQAHGILPVAVTVPSLCEDCWQN
jgi:lysophospholipase L1-like esterase